MNELQLQKKEEDNNQSQHCALSATTVEQSNKSPIAQ